MFDIQIEFSIGLGGREKNPWGVIKAILFLFLYQFSFEESLYTRLVLVDYDERRRQQQQERTSKTMEELELAAKAAASREPSLQ